VEAVDLQLLADFFQHAKLDLGMPAVGGDNVAGQGIGGLVQTLGQCLADQAEQGVEAVFLFERIAPSNRGIKHLERVDTHPAPKAAETLNPRPFRLDPAQSDIRWLDECAV